MCIEKKIGERIQCLRKEKKYSQELLAEEADLHRTYIGAVERGEKNLTVKNLEKITIALGISLEEFFCNKNK
jgi:XRE family transcriptional regulator, regulator of sulfur utilization